MYRLIIRRVHPVPSLFHRYWYIRKLMYDKNENERSCGHPHRSFLSSRIPRDTSCNRLRSALSIEKIKFVTQEIELVIQHHQVHHSISIVGGFEFSNRRKGRSRSSDRRSSVIYLEDTRRHYRWQWRSHSTSWRKTSAPHQFGMKCRRCPLEYLECDHNYLCNLLMHSVSMPVIFDTSS